MPKDFDLRLGRKDHYNSVSLKQHSRDELKKEYRRLRNEAKHRIGLLKNAGYGNEQILQNKEYLEKNPSDMTKEELVNYLSYTESFLQSDLSTVEGFRKRDEAVADKLRDLGYTHISKRNMDDFGKFMKDTKHLVDNKIVSSDILVSLFDMSVEKNISTANIKRNTLWYAEHLDDIEDLDLNESRKRAYTKTELERIFDRE